jgi:hypothetical protein
VRFSIILRTLETVPTLFRGNDRLLLLLRSSCYAQCISAENHILEIIIHPAYFNNMFMMGNSRHNLYSL